MPYQTPPGTHTGGRPTAASRFKEEDRLEEAESLLRKAPALQPDNPQALAAQAGIYMDKEQDEEAGKAHRKVLEIDPESADAMVSLGYLALQEGNITDAQAWMHRALESSPDNLSAHFHLLETGKVAPEHASVSALGTRLEVPKTLTSSKAASVHYGLGKAYSDLKEYDRAFEHFQEGARVKRGTLRYTQLEFHRTKRNVRTACITQVRQPLALHMALVHPEGNAAYLARPCQYVVDAEARGCGLGYWTSARYGPEVVAATDQAVSRLKTQTGARAVRLIGYSGGGTAVALVAARRDDIAGLITVAANLDHEAWTSHHRMTPLASSLNPADFATALVDTPQHHFAGAGDRIVPPVIAESFLQRFPSRRRPHLVIMEGYDHRCCWVAHWSDLYQALRRRDTGYPASPVQIPGGGLGK